jgi:hypothetical protein
VPSSTHHLIVEEHLLDNYDTGGLVSRRFDPSEDIAEAWLRLRDGSFRDSDIVLLEHELAESRYMREHPGATYREAHNEANRAGEAVTSQDRRHLLDCGCGPALLGNRVGGDLAAAPARLPDSPSPRPGPGCTVARNPTEFVVECGDRNATFNLGPIGQQQQTLTFSWCGHAPLRRSRPATTTGRDGRCFRPAPSPAS